MSPNAETFKRLIKTFHRFIAVSRLVLVKLLPRVTNRTRLVVLKCFKIDNRHQPLRCLDNQDFSGVCFCFYVTKIVIAVRLQNHLVYLLLEEDQS